MLLVQAASSTLGDLSLGSLIAIIGAVGALGAVVNAVFQRRKIGADATAVVTAAARELVDPLRKELATERAENAAEALERGKAIALVLADLDAASEQAHRLRDELEDCRRELDILRRVSHQATTELHALRRTHERETASLRARITELEDELATHRRLSE